MREILSSQGKKNLAKQILSGQVNIEEIILSSEYHLTNLDIWILAKAFELPIVLFSPVIGLLLHLPTDSYDILLISLLLGTPIFSLLGSIGSALTMSLKHGGLLLTVLVMPLLAPVLIFGAGAVVESALGNSASSHILFLTSLLILALTLVPFASAAVIKTNLE